MRKTTPRRPVQTDLPPRLLLNAAAARAVSFTLSPCLINFSVSVSPTQQRRERWLRHGEGLLLRAKLLFIADIICRAVSSIVGGAEAGHPGHGIITAATPADGDRLQHLGRDFNFLRNRFDAITGNGARLSRWPRGLPQFRN